MDLANNGLVGLVGGELGQQWACGLGRWWAGIIQPCICKLLETALHSLGLPLDSLQITTQEISLIPIWRKSTSLIFKNPYFGLHHKGHHKETVAKSLCICTLRASWLKVGLSECLFDLKISWPWPWSNVTIFWIVRLSTIFTYWISLLTLPISCGFTVNCLLCLIKSILHHMVLQSKHYWTIHALMNHCLATV